MIGRRILRNPISQQKGFLNFNFLQFNSCISNQTQIRFHSSIAKQTNVNRNSISSSLIGNSLPFQTTLLSNRRQFSSSSASSSSSLDSDLNSLSSIPASIRKRIGVNLHLQQNHPLCIIRERIEKWFANQYENQTIPFEFHNNLDPKVTIQQNFDELLVPADHVSRSVNDTYYINETHVLRCHTSAHQAELIRNGGRRFLATGDVYRCDTVDSTHFPVFHQMEGVRLFDEKELSTLGDSVEQQVEAIGKDMRKALEDMVRFIFGDVECRWVDAYFPFTDPSWELEIWYNDEWLEVLGCGVMQQKIIDDCDLSTHRGWAFGIGLERIAMALYNIPDIRLFWTNDKRFSDQFVNHEKQPNIKFTPYSKYPPIWHDVSFWLGDTFHPNKFHEIVRELGGDLVEDVREIDQFKHPKTGRESHAYRITFRHMDRSLTHDEIDVIMDELRQQLTDKADVELR